MAAPLSVRAGVYFAVVGGEGVVMDLINDRYYGLSAESAKVWRELQQRRSIFDLAACLHRSPEATADLLARQVEIWRRASLVVDGSDVGVPCPEAKESANPATRGLDLEQVASTPFSVSAAWDIVRALRWARRTMDALGICATLRQLQSLAPVTKANRNATNDERGLYTRVRAYRSVRRIMSQGRQDCLIRSLALAYVLKRHGWDCDLCFGVQKFPFIAHVWLETAGLAINDSPETISHLSILARF